MRTICFDQCTCERSIKEGAPVAQLQCNELIKGSDEVLVLEGMSLGLERGILAALTSPNGAGKSTLMKVASGQYRADSATVSVGGLGK
jgi:ribose transport system ATP-binding protein